MPRTAPLYRLYNDLKIEHTQLKNSHDRLLRFLLALAPPDGLRVPRAAYDAVTPTDRLAISETDDEFLLTPRKE